MCGMWSYQNVLLEGVIKCSDLLALSRLAGLGMIGQIITSLPNPVVLCHPTGWFLRLPLILTICLIVKRATVTAESSFCLKFLRPNRADLLLDVILDCNPLQYSKYGAEHKQSSTLGGGFSLMERLSPWYDTPGPPGIFGLKDMKHLYLDLMEKGVGLCPSFSLPLFFWVCQEIWSEYLSL